MTDNSTTSSSNYNNLQEKNQQVLSNISQLQSQEKQLYDSLNDVNLSSEEKQQIINKINEISQMRLNLYAGMKDVYSNYQQSVSSSRSVLDQEVNALDIIENELNQSKIRLNAIQDEKYNKLRLVEINTYYGKMYNSHTKIMQVVVIVCIPLIILAVLANRGILPPKLYMLLSAIIIIVAVYVIGKEIVELTNRDNMNWDEYNWYFNQSEAPVYQGDGTEGNPWAKPSVTCIGEACCYDGSTYDPEKNICMPNNLYNPVPTTETTVVNTTESFTSGKILEKYGYTQVKPVPINNYVVPLPSSLKKFS